MCLKKIIRFLLFTSVFIPVFTQTSDDFYNMGNGYYLQEQYEKAVEAYSRSIAMNPKDMDAYNNRGITYYQLGLFDLSIKDFNRVLENEPDAIFTYQSRAITYNTMGKFKDANEDYKMVIKIDPTFAYSYFGILYTSFHLSKTEFKEAYVYLLENKDILKKNEWLHQVFLYAAGELKDEELIEKAQNEQSRLNDAYFAIGFNYLRKRRKRKAKFFFTQCRETGLKDAPEYFLAKLELSRL